jgi:hypothetical protein
MAASRIRYSPIAHLGAPARADLRAVRRRHRQECVVGSRFPAFGGPKLPVNGLDPQERLLLRADEPLDSVASANVAGEMLKAEHKL